MGDRQPSLRRVLLLWLLLPLLLLVPLTAALIYGLALRPALDSLDRALTDTAVALAQIVDSSHGQVRLPLSEQTARALQADLVDEISFAVGDDAGHLLGGNATLLAQAPQMASGDWRFFESTLAGKPVRVAAHAIACGTQPSQVCAILVAETLGKRTAAERAVLLAALTGALALASMMVLLAMTAVSRGMRPLRRAAADVARRTPQRLEAIDTRAVPREVATFVEALNGLFGRLREAVAAQRNFVADAAHQLRTPLTVLNVEAAQVMATPHPAELRPALARLQAAAERGARLAQQLLVLARAEGSALDPRSERLDLSSLAAESADRWLQPSLQARQDLGFELAPAWVEGDALLLQELLGNLIHNAIEHAGAGTRITVRTWTQDGCARLCVEDDGRGMATEEQAWVWLRFRRGRDAMGSGSGLGLAIVHDIADLHGAVATLGPGEHGRGLRVSIAFPPCAPAADPRAPTPAARAAEDREPGIAMHLLPVPWIGVLVGLALQLATGPATAWGAQGHQAVGAIADQLIAGTPTASKVRQILGSTLQTAADWADCARSVESNQQHWSYARPGSFPDCAVYENPASEQALIDFVKRNASRCGGWASSAQCRHKAYHFVELSIEHTHYDTALPGTAPNDLVHAIHASIVVLQGGKSPAPFDIRGRREALRLLTHYLGDLHQPLHVGAIYLDDTGWPLDPATPQDAHDHGNAGGNQIRIEGRKLHQLWDEIPATQFKLLLSGGAAEARKVAATSGTLARWPDEWAGETTTEAARAFARLHIGAKTVSANGAEWPASAPEPDYRHAREALQHEQLVKAGARLAQVLTTLWP